MVVENMKMDIDKQTKEVKETAMNVVKDANEILAEHFEEVEAKEELKRIVDELKVKKGLQEEALKELEGMHKGKYFLIDIFRCLYVVLKKHEIPLDGQIIKKANIYPEMVVDEILKYVHVF